MTNQTLPQKVDKFLFDWALNLGPWFVPLATALVFGVSFAVAVKDELGLWAGIAGACAAVGLEVAGIIAFHVAVMNFDKGHTRKATVAALCGIGYVVIGMLGVLSLEGEDNQAFQVVGLIAFALVPIVYMVRALGLDLLRVETKSAQDEEEAKRLQQEQAAKFEANEQARLEAQRQDEKEAQQRKEELALKKYQMRLENKLKEKELEVELQALQREKDNDRTNDRPVRELPDWLTAWPETKSDFIEAAQGIPDKVTSNDLVDLGLVNNDRTGRRWLSDYREQNNGHAK